MSYVKYSYTTYPCLEPEINQNGNVFTGYSGSPVGDSNPEWYNSGSDFDYWRIMEAINDKKNQHESVYDNIIIDNNN